MKSCLCLLVVAALFQLTASAIVTHDPQEELKKVTRAFVQTLQSINQAPRLLQRAALKIQCNSFCLFLDCSWCSCTNTSCGVCFWNNGREICLECDDKACTGCDKNCVCTTCLSSPSPSCLYYQDPPCFDSEVMKMLQIARGVEASTKPIKPVSNTSISLSPPAGPIATAASGGVILSEMKKNITEVFQMNSSDSKASSQPYAASDTIKNLAMQISSIPNENRDSYFEKKFCNSFCSEVGDCANCQCSKDAICHACLKKQDLNFCMNCNAFTQQCYGCIDCLCYSCKLGSNCDFFSNKFCTKDEFQQQLNNHRANLTDTPTGVKNSTAISQTLISVVDGDIMCKVLCGEYLVCEKCNCVGPSCQLCYQGNGICPVCSKQSLTCRYCSGCSCYTCDRYDVCQTEPDPTCST